ncbi:peptidyl-lys metalloendopeptidase, partial [Rhizoctonia solani AG-3 Rhs1AP]
MKLWFLRFWVCIGSALLSLFYLKLDMFITAAFVLFTALLASADSAPPSMPINGPAGIDHVPAAKGKHFSLEKAHVSPKTSPLSKRARASYYDCSPGQKQQIISAVEEAQKYATAAYRHLKSNRNNSTLYTEWFGEYDHKSYNSVLKSSSKLRKLPQSWKYLCQRDCPEDRDSRQRIDSKKRIAWVNKKLPGTFNICPAFWKLPPVKNSNLKAFNIIQEGTHFREVLGTVNYEYSYSDCLELAAQPDRARMNGPNYAYFILGAWGKELQKKKGGKFGFLAKFRSHK